MRNKWSRFEKAVNALCGISMALIGLWMCHNFYKIYERDHLKPSVASSNTPVAASSGASDYGPWPLECYPNPLEYDIPSGGWIPMHQWACKVNDGYGEAPIDLKSAEDTDDALAALQSQVAKLREQVKALQPPNVSSGGTFDAIPDYIPARPTTRLMMVRTSARTKLAAEGEGRKIE